MNVALPQDAIETFKVFLIGDTGGHQLIDGQLPTTYSLLNQQLRTQDANSAVVFLGDNIYCCGLQDSASVKRDNSIAVADALIAAVDGFSGRVIIVPGNHDWNDSSTGGLDAVNRQEAYFEDAFDQDNVFVPDNGFPGPHLIKLSDDLSLVALDTEWWLSEERKSFGDAGKYDIDEEQDVFLELDHMLKDELDKDDVLVVGHHPMFTNGIHGGHYQPKMHLFPLAMKFKRAYIPLPVVGTLAAAYLKYFGGSRQDTQHRRYRELRAALTRIFSSHESLVYASGHEHSLQYFQIGNDHLHQDYVVSGSGSKPSYVAGGKGASFTANPEGYATLQYFSDHSVWLSFWDTESNPDEAQLLFRKQLREGRVIVDVDDPNVFVEADSTIFPDYSDSLATLAINPSYAAGPAKSFLLGSHNRDLWTEPVTAPMLDLSREAGGLTPVKRGGGMQTISLRLQGADGEGYVLRSLDKDPSGTVPVILQGTIATDIVQDQITSINPYGAFIIPPLARAAGVFYTEPKLVFVPDDPRLGVFRKTFAGQLMMFEHRPDDDESDKENYGYSSKVISASKLYQVISEDNDDRVDQRAFARVRLFDMLLSDWDRHRDQWRWAEFDDTDGKGNIYRPIPRDRDWAFNKMNGLPTLASQFDPKFQDFSDSFGYLKGLSLNGHEQDRRFLNEVTKDEWVQIASEISAAITDMVVDSAVALWPPEIRALAGPETARLLKIRREQLPDIAAEYYSILAGVVDWVGSEKHERVVLTSNRDGTLDVEIFKISKTGEVRQSLYKRKFDPDETKEIRLFGLGGNDEFVFRGSRSSIDIIVVGGPGDDLVDNTADIRVHYFDTDAQRSSLQNVVSNIESDPAVNDYNPLDFSHDSRLPQFYFGHNAEDGRFLGGGLKFVKKGFRKPGFARSRRIVANFSTRTKAFNVDYQSVLTDVSGVWDAKLHVYASSPATIYNFFGFGNETEITDGVRRFYESRLTRVAFEPLLQADIDGGLSISFGPTFNINDVEIDEDRYLFGDTDVDPGVYDTQYHAGLQAQIGIIDVEGGALPQRGLAWFNTISSQAGVSNSSDLFVKMTTDLRLYASPARDRMTIVIRVGSDHIVGDFPYYASSSLGGQDKLRGYRSSRYNGRTSLYTSAEMRIRLLNYSTYITTGKLGVLGFVDNGRVWYDGESSTLWHQGYGGGIWTNMLDVITLSAWWAKSPDNTTFSFGFGFQY